MRAGHLLCALLSAAACSSDAPIAAAPNLSPVVVSLAVLPRSSSTVPLGSRFGVDAFAVRSDCTRIPLPASWTLLEHGVLDLDAAGNAVAVGLGTAVVDARADGFTDTTTMTVVPVWSPDSSGAVTVNSFSVVELEYSSGCGNLFYAPLLNLTARPGLSLTVVIIEVTAPGIFLLPAGSFVCANNDGCRLGAGRDHAVTAASDREERSDSKVQGPLHPLGVSNESAHLGQLRTLH